MSASATSSREWGFAKKEDNSLSGIELEPLSHETEPIDFELTLFQALVNEGKHIRVLNAKRPQYFYDEKQLRDAAAAEVAHQGGGDDGDKSSRKRKHLNADEKAKQKWANNAHSFLFSIHYASFQPRQKP